MFFKKIINTIVGGNNNICLLCFQSIENMNNCVHVNDHIFLDKQETATLLEILSTIIGANLLEDTYLTNICLDCAKLAINSYMFKEMCLKNYGYLVNTVSCLTKAMITTLSNIRNCKSLFMVKDKNNERYQSYFGYTSAMNVNDAFKLLKSLKKEGINRTKHDRRKNKHHVLKKSSVVEILAPCITSGINHNAKESPSVTDLKSDIVELEEFYTHLKHKGTEMENSKNNKTCFKCKKCIKTFTTSSSLKQHIKRIHAPKVFKCTKCPRQYGSANILETHMYESHTDSICSTCGKTFSKQSLKFHELSHKTKLICPTCGRVYKQKITYNKHIAMKICEQTSRKTLSQAKFTCDVCEKKFCQKSSLRIHMTFEHGNKKAYTCDWCNKQFYAMSKLNAHIVTHTQEKKFTCEHCGGHFVTMESLLYHTRIHTGEKPYQCKHCKQKFLSSSRRAEHIRRHHLDPTLECDICHKKFKIKFSLQEHRNRHFNPTSKLYNPELAENYAKD